MLEGKREIIKGFADLLEVWERDADLIPRKFSENWIFSIQIVDAVDEGDYLRAVDFHEVSSEPYLQQFQIDTSNNPDVTYEGFVEGGTKYMEARFPAQKGIERTDLVNVFDYLMDKGFRSAKKQ